MIYHNDYGHRIAINYLNNDILNPILGIKRNKLKLNAKTDKLVDLLPSCSSPCFFFYNSIY